MRSAVAGRAAEAAAAIHRTLATSLHRVVPYAEVAAEVARYNHERFAHWVNATGPRWVDQIHAPGRWSVEEPLA